MYQTTTFDGARALEFAPRRSTTERTREIERQSTAYAELALLPARAAATLADLAACTDPVEITKDKFENVLAFGYFEAWHKTERFESIRCPEAHIGNVHTHWVRVGDRYFQLRRPNHESHHALYARVEQKLRLETTKAMFA